jgi:hypothetical protein
MQSHVPEVTKTNHLYGITSEMKLSRPVSKSIAKARTNGEFYRPRLSGFFNQTFGAWNSGALVKNKLFYFALLEKQSETRPQPYDMSTYVGNSKEQDILTLSEFIKGTYNYDPGSFLETKDVLEAFRLILKFDWNPSRKNKFTLSYRYNHPERTLPSSRVTIL